jgi:hypothetical protein
MIVLRFVGMVVVWFQFVIMIVIYKRYKIH